MGYHQFPVSSEQSSRCRGWHSVSLIVLFARGLECLLAWILTWKPPSTPQPGSQRVLWALEWDKQKETNKTLPFLFLENSGCVVIFFLVISWTTQEYSVISVSGRVCHKTCFSTWVSFCMLRHLNETKQSEQTLLTAKPRSGRYSQIFK